MSGLHVEHLNVHHGQLQALTDLELDLVQGQVLAVIGANGAGKSTLLRTIAGVLRPSSGRVLLDGADLAGVPTHQRVARGIAMVPEGRRLFGSLDLLENLQTGTYRARPGPWSVARVLRLFPWMAERRHQRAGQLSGGEQQAVAIGRALVSNPRVLLMDEISLGLAPVVVKTIYATLPTILAEGTAVLLVEQDVSQALRVADHVHCLLEGRNVLSGTPSELTLEQIQQAYFGVGAQPVAPNEGGTR